MTATPSIWSCPDEQYNTQARQITSVPVTCDCDCGALDPDCFNDPNAPIFGCQYGETCSQIGTCVNGQAVAITWINKNLLNVTGSNPTVEFNQLVNENPAIINTTERALRVLNRFTWDNNDASEFLTAQDITISDGLLESHQAATLTFSGSCALKDALTLDTLHWTPPAASLIAGGSIDIATLWNSSN